MKDFSTKNLIRLLPIAEDFKKLLLEQIDIISSDKKSELDELIWDAYYALYKLRLDRNIQKALDDESENGEKIDQDFYIRIKNKTEAEMQQLKPADLDQEELKETRQKLEEVLQNEKADSTNQN